jgi:hypothetical protein
MLYQLKSIIAILSLPVLVFSSTPDSTDQSLNKRALLFSISKLSLNSYDGSTLSYMMENSKGHTYRFSLSIIGDFEKRNFDYDYLTMNSDFEPTDTTGTENVEKEHDYDITIGAYKIWRLEPHNNFRGFYGLGPFLSLNRSTDDNEYDYLKESTNIQHTTWEDSKVTDFTIGTKGLFGVEWMINQNIHILSEYATSLYYRFYKKDYEGETYTLGNYRLDGDNRTYSTIDFSSTVRFGVAFYF